MPDIFDEVEEDLRAEQMRRLLRRYGGLLVAALVLVVLGVAGWQAWQWREQRQAAAVAARYETAAKAPPGPAVAQFAAIAQDPGPDGYRTLARLQQAALLARQGKYTEAGALWDKVQSDPAADPLLRDVAGLQWVEHFLGTAPPGELAARVAPLAQADKPLHGLAQEAQALIDLRQGLVVEARDTLRMLTHDNAAPDGVRQRAGWLLAQLPTAPPPPGPSGNPSDKGHGS